MERRKFLQTTMIGTAATVVVPTIIPASVMGKNAPSNKINIGGVRSG